MRKQWFIMIAIIALIAVALFHTATTREEPLPKTGFEAPLFTLQSMDDQTYSMEMLNGKPVVINFWASWCGPCRIEMPELDRLYAKYHAQLEIYAVNTTASDNEQLARNFAEQYQFSFPVLLDTSGEVAKKYKIQSMPTTFFVNRDGIIVDQVTGLIPTKTIEDKFKQLLK